MDVLQNIAIHHLDLPCTYKPAMLAICFNQFEVLQWVPQKKLSSLPTSSLILLAMVFEASTTVSAWCSQELVPSMMIRSISKFCHWHHPFAQLESCRRQMPCLVAVALVGLLTSKPAKRRPVHAAVVLPLKIESLTPLTPLTQFHGPISPFL